MAKKITNKQIKSPNSGSKTIEQIDYDLKADDKFPADKLYPKTEQNKQEKEIPKNKKSLKNAEIKTGNMKSETKRKGNVVRKKDSKEKNPDETTVTTNNKNINEAEEDGSVEDLSKTIEIKNEIKKFFALKV